MDKNNEVKSFFESPFAKNFLNSTDYLVRRSVTGISASCEILRGNAEKNGDKLSCELIEGIMTTCCELMRNAELSKALASVGDGAENDMQTVRMDHFIVDFAKNCNAVMSGKCTVETVGCPTVYVRANAEILRFILLSFVRRSILESDGGKAEFEAGCKETGKSVEIFIRAKRTFVDETLLGRPDVFETYHSEILDGLSARTGAETICDNEGITVVIPHSDANSPAVVESPSAELGERFFSAFNIMLRDLLR